MIHGLQLPVVAMVVFIGLIIFTIWVSGKS
jgi:hypothetical protein